MPTKSVCGDDRSNILGQLRQLSAAERETLAIPTLAMFDATTKNTQRKNIVDGMFRRLTIVCIALYLAYMRFRTRAPIGR